MKFVLIATFVALATASAIYTNKVISLTPDGSFLIDATNGKSLLITRPLGLTGQKYIEIALNGPSVPLKKIDITDDSLIGQVPVESKVNGVVEEELVLKKGHPSVHTQGEVLFQILEQYQGTVTAPLFEKLLYRVQKAVQQGLLTQHIYDILAGIDQIDEVFAQVLAKLSVVKPIVTKEGLYNHFSGAGLVNSVVGQNALLRGYPVNTGLGYSTLNNVYPSTVLQQQQLYGNAGINHLNYGIGNQQLVTPFVNSWIQKYTPLGQYYNQQQQLQGFYSPSVYTNGVVGGLLNGNLLAQQQLYGQNHLGQQQVYGQNHLAQQVYGQNQLGQQQVYGQSHLAGYNGLNNQYNGLYNQYNGLNNQFTGLNNQYTGLYNQYHGQQQVVPQQFVY